jgi:hypothetical protein
VCERVDWERPNGKLEKHECRLLREWLRHQGIVSLSMLQPVRGARTAPDAPQFLPGSPTIGSAGEFKPLRLTLVGDKGQDDLRLWGGVGEGLPLLGAASAGGRKPPLFGASPRGREASLASRMGEMPRSRLLASDIAPLMMRSSAGRRNIHRYG